MSKAQLAQDGRTYKLEYLTEQSTTLRQRIDQNLAKGLSTTSEPTRRLIVAETRQLMLEYAAMIWDATQLKMELSQELPAWEITEALHNLQTGRYAYVRLDGINPKQELLLESFDEEGNGCLERLDILQFHPEQWDCIPRKIYEDRLQRHIENNTITWSITC